MSTAEAPPQQPAAAPDGSHSAENHLQAALQKLQQNLATYVLGCFLLAWCLTGVWLDIQLAHALLLLMRTC